MLSDRTAQLCEVALVQSIYCGVNEFRMHTPELAEQLQELLDEGDEDALAPRAAQRLRYSVCLRMGDGDAAATVEIECDIPADYPSQSLPHLYARSSSALFDGDCSRRCNELLAAHVASLAQARPDQPDEREVCVTQIVQWAQEHVPVLLRDSAARQAQRPGVATGASTTGAALAASCGPSAPLSFQRELILFHHMYSSTKRRAVLDAARQLGLTGVAKSGKPGFVIVEGDAENVREWIGQIKQLSWQRMTCKLSQVVRAPTSVSGSCPSSRGSFLDSQRKFASFLVLAPLAGSGAQWPTMTQLVDLVAPLGLQDAVRDALGLGQGQGQQGEGSAEEEGAAGSDEDEAGAATPAAAASAPAARKLDKRSQKEAEKRIARQLQQVQLANAGAAAAAGAAAGPPPVLSAPAPNRTGGHRSTSKGSASAAGRNPAASASATVASVHASDLACVEVLPPSGSGSASSSSSTSSSAAPGGVLPPLHTVKLHVRARPGASCSELLSLGDAGEAVHLALAAPPRDGAANAAALKLVTQLLGLQSRQVELVGGDKSRDKTILLRGVAAPADICARLRALCPPQLLPPPKPSAAPSALA